MVESSVRRDAPQAAARAGLRVVRAEEHAADACVDDGAGAHGARLERHRQRAVGESPRAARATGLAHGGKLGVAGGVAGGLAVVGLFRHHGAALVNDGAHGHLTLVRRVPRERHGAEHHAHVVGARPRAQCLRPRHPQERLPSAPCAAPRARPGHSSPSLPSVRLGLYFGRPIMVPSALRNTPPSETACGGAMVRRMMPSS